MRAVLALIVLLAFAVAPVRALDGRRLRLHGGRLVDERRREVTLRGVNARVEGIFDVTFDDGRLPLEAIPVFDDGDAATMERFGFNLLRLPISWSALEPARGRFDAAYLDRIAGVLALCFAREPAVLGYEIMNEPLAFLVPNGDVALLAFHVRLARAIRRVDHRHLVAFEPDAIRNATNAAPVPTAPFPVRGALYAPHVYTDVFDGHDYSSGDPAELAPSMERAAAEARGWGAPLLVGEYGIDPNAPNANAWITAELDLQDRLRTHSAFWLWEEISATSPDAGRVTVADGSSARPARAGDPSRWASSCIRPRPERWRSSRRRGRRSRR